MNVPIIIGIVSGLSGAVGVYLISLRKLSGTVKHSEAEDLWVAMKTLTDDLTQRNKYLRDRLDRCEQRVADLEARIDVLGQSNLKLRNENLDLKRENGDSD